MTRFITGDEIDTSPHSTIEVGLRLRVVHDGPGYRVEPASDDSDRPPPWPDCACALSPVEVSPNLCSAEYRYVTYFYDDTLECAATTHTVRLLGDGAERNRMPAAIESMTYVSNCSGETDPPTVSHAWASRE